MAAAQTHIGVQCPTSKRVQQPEVDLGPEKDGVVASPEFRVPRANVRSSASLLIRCHFSVRIEERTNIFVGPTETDT